MSKNQSSKSVGLFALIVFALGGGATYFQFNKVKEANAKVAELQQQVPNQKELQKELADSSAQLASFRTQIAHLESNVPDVAYVPTLMKELEQVGQDHHIKVIGVRPAPQSLMPTAKPEDQGNLREAKKDYQEIEIEVKGRGNYDDIKSFLDALKDFPKVIAVKTVSLSPERDNGPGGSKQLEATVNVLAFVFPFEFVAGKASSQQSGAASTVANNASGASPFAGAGGQAHE